jgi:hypothetical protein
MESSRRDSPGGKNALIAEIVNVVPKTTTTCLVRIFNNKATPYYSDHTTTPQYFTTGAAILQNINHVMFVSGIQLLATGIETTTSHAWPITGKLINGPTTLVDLYCKGTQVGAVVRVLILGKSF